MKGSRIKTGAPSGKRQALGICLGASTVSVVRVSSEPGGATCGEAHGRHGVRIVDHLVRPHGGNPRQVLRSVLEETAPAPHESIVVTGRRFRDAIRLSSVPEPEAVECAYPHVKLNGTSCPAIISGGGETFMVYVLDRAGRISNVVTGNKCASGTGEFFLQQLRRMDVSLEQAAQWTATEKPYRVCGRCSVFCKSDCTHATNKGVPKSHVTAGLCRMMANKILELLKRVERRNIMLVGGTARNRMMVEYLAKEIDGLIVPDEAPYFEALGAALWALSHETLPFPGIKGLFHEEATSFEALPSLARYEKLVTFKSIQRGRPVAGDTCILGLDVGSTTTKATLLRCSDDALLASVYLRTSGDPVGAARRCYRAILDRVTEQVTPSQLCIHGLGICGSGRQIAGLHALTDGVVNEIVAHAAAAAHFDPAVDTIFEIGGQDAKYTFMTHGMPSDYAMNEACSAGTGSFLEESAHETLGLAMEEIGDVAIKGESPPNFNDQCAAFIASDIKNAIQEGVGREDIVAGLVYSICMNYVNRVKGNRPVGEKIFMQGGVCYNRAVPLAMAGLVGKPIVVPPEPGLMGAFGAALEVKRRIAEGAMAPKLFDLEVLAGRQVDYASTFICKGGRAKCDRRCEISVVKLEGNRYPFGGACNRYYNLRRHIRCDVEQLDLVQARRRLVFETHAGRLPEGVPGKGRVGLNRSFLVNTYYPLYSTFFAELGYEPVLPDTPDQEGIDRRHAAFCFPAELAHGFFFSLLHARPALDYIFLPHLKAVPDGLGEGHSQVCPLVQGETFYLRSTFKERLSELAAAGTRVLAPLVDLTEGIGAAETPLVAAAVEMGVGQVAARAAFQKALRRQRACEAEMKAMGRDALDRLASDPDRVGVVLFGRPYSGFVDEAHMGIPRKMASRDVAVIPLDMLPLESEKARSHMYWGMGQTILKGARFVKRHDRLFGVYVTNFSCGPDSFLCGYFRNIMGRKPSLTLELDSHTADAGLETRIEAFLDIVRTYGRSGPRERTRTRPFVPARIVNNGQEAGVVTSAGRELSLTDPRVTVVVPSMGRLTTEAVRAALRASGMRGLALPPADEEVLKLGRGSTSCKECLPHILTVGSLLRYLRDDRKPGDVTVYLFPSACGPCRLGQYNVFTKDLIERRRIEDVAILSASAADSYMGLEGGFLRRAWCGTVASDAMEDIRIMLLANACDRSSALNLFEEEWSLILRALETGNYGRLETCLRQTADKLRAIPLRRPRREVPVVSLTGEIFVRRDALSRRQVSEWLADHGFATTCVPVAEWMQYCNYMVSHGLLRNRLSPLGKAGHRLRRTFQNRYERRIKGLLGRSGLVRAAPVDIASIIHCSKPYISTDLQGEAVLTVGGALDDIASTACGVISIGPFGCMPSRLSESLLRSAMNRAGKLGSNGHDPGLRAVLEDMDDLPFLSIETDGSPFPQLVLARLEAFCLQAERLHARMLAHLKEPEPGARPIPRSIVLDRVGPAVRKGLVTHQVH